MLVGSISAILTLNYTCRLWNWYTDWTRERDFVFFKMPMPDLIATQLPIQCVLGALNPGVNWVRYEGDHSPSFTSKFKNTATTPVCFHSVY